MFTPGGCSGVLMNVGSQYIPKVETRIWRSTTDHVFENGSDVHLEGSNERDRLNESLYRVVSV